MTRHLLRPVLVGAALLACSLSIPAAAQHSVRRDAGVAFAGQPLANPRGALSLSTNPAGLTDLMGWESRLQLSGGGGFVGGQKGNGGGFFYGSGGGSYASGVGVERVTHAIGEPTTGDDPGVGSWRISVGGGWRVTDRLRLGWATRLLGTEEPDTATPLTADFGLLYRPWSWLSLGARVTGLSVGAFGRGATIDGFPTTRFGWGLAVRPFAGSDRLTVAFDLDWPAGDTLGDTTFSLASRIVDGVVLMFENRTSRQNKTTGLGGKDDNRSALLLSFGFGRFGADLSFGGSKSQISGNQQTAQLGVRMSSDVPHSLTDPHDEVVVVKLSGAQSEIIGDGHFPGLLLTLRDIARAAKTRTVVLQAQGLKLTWGQVEELRAAIARLKKAGKAVVMYADSLGTRAYMVAVACDRIGLPPHGYLSVSGVGADFVGFSETLAKIGVAMEVARFSEHKSAPEMFTRTAISRELAATLHHIVRRRWRKVAEAVALGRQMTTTVVDSAIERGVVYPPDALQAGFIDAVATPKEFEDLLSKWKLVTAGERLKPYVERPKRVDRWGNVPRLAVVTVAGTIVGGKSAKGPLGAQVGGAEVAKHLRSLKRRSDIKGIAMRIDSGGGSVAGSDIMYQELRAVAAKKPVYASLAAVAASGGYWTALGADRIFANASTITGSIGIWTARPDLAGLWAKLGLGITQLGAGPHHHLATTSRPWTEPERAFVRRNLNRFYGLFLSRVQDRRGIERPRLLNLAGGRLWFGDEARSRDLVDEIGGFEATLDALRTKLKIGIDDPVQIEFWPRPDLRSQLLRAVGFASHSAQASSSMNPLLATLTRALGPWLDAATLAATLPAGAPLAIAPVPPATPAP